MKSGEVLYTKKDDTIVLKYVGDVRYTLCPALSRLISDLSTQEGFRNIVIDLTEVDGIDSTNLGLLARIANMMNDRFSRRATLISTNSNVNRTLDTVGFLDIFIFDENRRIDEGDMNPLPESVADEDEVGAAILEAHRILSEISDENREAFRSVVEGLEDELNPRRDKGSD